MFKGSMVALVTPFKDGRVDVDAYKELIEFQISNGTDGIVPCGTTGESATLSHDEHRLVVETAVKTAAGRVRVIAGSGSNSTVETIELTRFAKDIGADGALIITPYYNKPTQAGLFGHFKTVAESVDIPIVLYNVPGRTSVNLLPDTVVQLAEIPNIVAIKEAAGSIKQASEIIIRCGDKLGVISGDDFITLSMLHVGGVGSISVTANIVPKDSADMMRAFEVGDHKEALRLHNRLFALHEVMFIETNPIPVKAALHMMGRMGPDIRMPMCHLSDLHAERLTETLKQYGNLI